MFKRITVTVFIVMSLLSSMALTSAKTVFVDVKTPSWYSEAVTYVVDRGYMVGVTKDQFDPFSNVTRAQIVQIIYAMEGKPTVITKTGFSDVTDGKWYSAALYWASSKNMVSGYPDGTFQPNQAITREQMTAILFRYSAIKGYDTEINSQKRVEKFSDAGQVSNYARESVEWAVQKNIISGTQKGIEPKSFANRAQIAVILNAFDRNVAGKNNDKGQSEENEGADNTEPSHDNNWETPIVDAGSSVSQSEETNRSDSRYSTEFTWETPIA